MSKLRFQALALACVMMMSMFLGGCRTSKKSTGKDDVNKKAESMLDDFGAYYKIGKYDKIDKLISGKSTELEKLKGYKDSEVKSILEAARKRISFSVEKVSCDEAEETGTAVLIFSYFDIKDLQKKISSDSSITEVANAVKEAKEKELRYDVELVFSKNWLIEAESVDSVISGMFSFLDDLHFDVAPTTTAKPTAMTITEFSNAWYDKDFNEVLGYHESDEYILFTVVPWENCIGEKITFEFNDENSNVYIGEYQISGNSNLIKCVWEPGYKLPVGWIACYVYDGNGSIISVGCIQIYSDEEAIPVQMSVTKISMLDENGKLTPGFHVGDKIMRAEVEVPYVKAGMIAGYEIRKFDDNDPSGTQVHSGSFTISDLKTRVDFDGFVPKETGSYRLTVTDMTENVIWETEFLMIGKGEEFKTDSTIAAILVENWCTDQDGIDVITKVPKDSKIVYYYFSTYSFWKYMTFAYELEDGSGRKVDEGTAVMINSDCAHILIDMEKVSKGPLKLKIYNPDGSKLTEAAIEVET